MRPSTTLRGGVLAIDLVALWALGASGLLSAPTCVVGALLVVVASVAARELPSPSQAAGRRAASIGLLLLSGLAVVLRVAGGSEGLLGTGPVLALLITGLMAAHTLVLDSRRDLQVGLALGVATVILAAGYAPGPQVAVPLVVAWLLALLTLAVGQHEERREPAAAVLGRPRRLPRAALPAAALAVVLGLVVYLLTPQPSGLAVRSRLLGTGDGSGDGTGSDGPPATRSTSFFEQGTLDLTARGALPDTPVLDVPDDSPALWRGSVLSTYDGRQWTGVTLRQAGLLAGGPTYVVPTPLDPVPPDPVGAGTPRTDQVGVVSPSYDGLVIAPGPVSSVTSATGRAVLDSTGSVRLLDPGAPLGVRSFTVGSLVPVTDAATLEQAQGADQTEPHWLQLPATVPSRVGELAASLTDRAPTRYQKVRAVEDYLRTHEEYRLDSPTPAPGDDAVDDFLFVSHAGFCEQFASAEVVLLRSAGIPSRLVTGFAYGHPDGGGRRLFKASDAHAWVEVWYPGIGWSTSDPTAGAQLAPASAPSLLDRLTEVLTASTAERALAAVLLLVAALVVGLLALVAVVGVRRGSAARARRRQLRDGGGEPGPVLTAYARLARALERAGRERHPAETLGELADRLPDVGGQGSTRAALRTLERECYAAVAPEPAEQAGAVATLERLTDRVLEEARR